MPALSSPSWVFLDLGPPCLFFPILTQWDSSQECVKTRAAESALTSRLQCASKAVWLQFTPFEGLLHRQRKAASRLPSGDAFLAFSTCLCLCDPGRVSELGERWTEVVGNAVPLAQQSGLVCPWQFLDVTRVCHTMWKGEGLLFLSENMTERLGTLFPWNKLGWF